MEIHFNSYFPLKIIISAFDTLYPIRIYNDPHGLAFSTDILTTHVIHLSPTNTCLTELRNLCNLQAIYRFCFYNKFDLVVNKIWILVCQFTQLFSCEKIFIVWFQKISIPPPPQKVTGNSEGEGGSKAEISEGSRGSWEAPFPEGEETRKNCKQHNDWSQARSNTHVGCFHLQKQANMLTKCRILRLWFVWNFGTPDLHVRVYGKLRVSLAFREYFNPFNETFFSHQTCLSKYKNILIVHFQPLFTGYHRDRIVALHRQWRS